MMEDVEDWLRGHESARDMLRRILPRTSAVTPLVPALQRVVNLHGRHVVEVAGASGCAKSEFLLQAAVKCLLPKQGYGGWEGGVLWFDLDGHFDVLRLVRLLQSNLYQEAQQRQGQRGEGQGKEMGDGEQVLKACMERFLFTRCYSSIDFLCALKNSRKELMRVQGHGKAVRLLVVDSIAAFYWLDRAAPSTVKTNGGRTSLSLQGVMQALVRELKELRNLSTAHELLVMVSKCNIFSSSFTDAADWIAGNHKETTEVEFSGLKDLQRSGPQQREFMPAVWQEFVTRRLQLKSSVVEGETIFTAEWLRPPLSWVDAFTIDDTGLKLTT